jgi:hypothetical protein
VKFKKIKSWAFSCLKNYKTALLVPFCFCFFRENDNFSSLSRFLNAASCETFESSFPSLTLLSDHCRLRLSWRLEPQMILQLTCPVSHIRSAGGGGGMWGVGGGRLCCFFFSLPWIDNCTTTHIRLQGTSTPKFLCGKPTPPGWRYQKVKPLRSD